MRYAVIADVHGNYPALQAVLRDAKKAGAEQFLFLGDYMTDFPFAREIVAVLRSLPHAVFVSGNREWYLDSLDPAQRGLEQYAALFLKREQNQPTAPTPPLKRAKPGAVWFCVGEDAAREAHLRRR